MGRRDTSLRSAPPCLRRRLIVAAPRCARQLLAPAPGYESKYPFRENRASRSRAPALQARNGGRRRIPHRCLGTIEFPTHDASDGFDRPRIPPVFVEAKELSLCKRRVKRTAGESEAPIACERVHQRRCWVTLKPFGRRAECACAEHSEAILEFARRPRDKWECSCQNPFVVYILLSQFRKTDVMGNLVDQISLAGPNNTAGASDAVAPSKSTTPCPIADLKCSPEPH